MKRYKFLRTGLKSENGNVVWRLGKWKKYDGELELCKSGFHCSVEPFDAFSFVQGERLAEVEVRGKHLEEKDKQVWEEMRVVKTYKWTKKDSVRLAIYSAELVLSIYEKEYPNDKRPRKAIEAAKEWLRHPSKKAANAADAAYAAANAATDAAYVAADAADAAAYLIGAAMIKKIKTYFRKIVREKQSGR